MEWLILAPVLLFFIVLHKAALPRVARREVGHAGPGGCGAAEVGR